MSDLEDLKKKLPFSIQDDKILREVFVHSSYLNETGDKNLVSNERLEFLGDAILGSIVSHMLFVKFPLVAEGELTKLRARLVNKQKLAEISNTLGLGDYLLLGKGERQDEGGTTNASILADTFEALIAALYLDKKEDGYREAYKFLEIVYTPLLSSALNEPKHFDYKPALQEFCQGRLKSEPAYRVVSTTGPPHQRVFDVEVLVDGKTLGRAEARKIKEAEQLAAKQALATLEKDG